MAESIGPPPGLGDIERIAADAYERIPDILRARADEVRIRVEEFPSEEVMRDMELETPFDLLGLYQGVPFGEKSVSDVAHDIDMIFLYRRPLLDYWAESGERLEDLVRNVLIHEIGHHFGFSDAEMEKIEQSG
jgi:predicted Zn-dependent protease with MMP-like domain